MILNDGPIETDARALQLSLNGCNRAANVGEHMIAIGQPHAQSVFCGMQGKKWGENP